MITYTHGETYLEVLNISELHQFSKKHSNARKPLSNWLDLTMQAEWDNFLQLRGTFRSADYVKNLVIFDIGGNNYRLIASIDYTAQYVYILEIMTHAEYTRWKP